MFRSSASSDDQKSDNHIDDSADEDIKIFVHDKTKPIHPKNFQYGAIPSNFHDPSSSDEHHDTIGGQALSAQQSQRTKAIHSITIDILSPKSKGNAVQIKDQDGNNDHVTVNRTGTELDNKQTDRSKSVHKLFHGERYNLAHNMNKKQSMKLFMREWFKKYSQVIIFTIITSIYVILSVLISDDNGDAGGNTLILRVEFILANITIISVFVLVYKLLTYLLFVCVSISSNRTCICCKLCKCDTDFFIDKVLFYIKHSETYLSCIVICIFIYILIFNREKAADSRYHDVFTHIRTEYLELISNSLICIIILFIVLFIKVLLIKHLLIKHYLPTSLRKIHDMKQYEKWLKILLNTSEKKEKEIFSLPVKRFININDVFISNNKHKSLFGLSSTPIDFSLTILKSSKLSKKSDSDAFYSLWNYDPQTNHTHIATSYDLDKLSESFADFILASTMDTNINGDGRIKLDNNEQIDNKDKFIHYETFTKCFKSSDEDGDFAWETMNVVDSNDDQLTFNELQSCMKQYFHDLIYLKQSLNSYEEILHNLDMSSNVFVIFFVLFIFLFVFNDSFAESVTMYAAMIAVFAIFGGSMIKEFLDSIYFVFILQPYSIGDVIEINDIGYTVQHINIMTTELITCITKKHFTEIRTNSSLLKERIQNVSRSKTPYHTIPFYISQLTSSKQIDDLKKSISDWIEKHMETDINDYWFILDGIDKECRMKITLYVGSNYSFADTRIAFRQHHAINKQIISVVNEMGIQYKRFSIQDIQVIQQSS